MLVRGAFRGLPAALTAAILALVGGTLPAHADTEPPAPPAAPAAPSVAAPAAVQATPATPQAGTTDTPRAAAAPDAGAGRSMRKNRPGGVNPCMTPDPGYGIYDEWARGISMGQLLAPQRGGLTKSGGFDLIVHFHGNYPVRKEFVKSARGIVLVAIDLGVGSGAYYQAFASPQAFENLIASVEKEMTRRNGGKKARVRKLALSSWSAGYGAIAQILRQPLGRKVDALVLLDSLHAGYANASAPKLSDRLRVTQLDPFVDFAKKAARGQKLMFQSHSSITPPGYGSTREVSSYMVQALGGKMKKAKRSDVLGLQMFERFDRGGYKVRGYRGDDKPDHCAHLGLVKDVVRLHLGKRWRSPRGYAGSKPREAVREAVQVAKQSGAKQGGAGHVVAKGDTLTGIAQRHGVPVAALLEANGLNEEDPIRIGQELTLPGKDSKDAAAATNAAEPAAAAQAPKAGEKTHVVQEGQSLRAIGKRYRVTVDAIRERNRLARGGRRIQPGDKLVIPAPKTRSDKAASAAVKPAAPLRPGETTHVVAEGQSLSRIAKRYRVSVNAIRERNGLAREGRRIQPGDRLVIPVSKKN
jgi:LysM repeat protein